MAREGGRAAGAPPWADVPALGGWSLHERLREHARRRGEAPALLDDRGSITWRDLDRRADIMAGRLRKLDVAPGDLVALLPDGPTATIVALLGLIRARAVAAPVPPGLTARERLAALETVAARAVFAPGDLVAEPGDPDHTDVGEPPDGPDPEAPAVIVLTSGTAGRPKGVVLSAAALAASADAWIAALPPSTGWLLAVGLAHVAGLGIVWRAIRAGVPIRSAPPADPEAQLSALRAEPPLSHVSLVPAQLARLLDAAAPEPAPATLRAVLLGGGPIPPDLVRRAIEAGWPVAPTYGLSETGSGVTAPPTADAATDPGTAGRPLAGSRIEIRDAGPDGIGEITVTTPSGFSGYLHGPARLRTDPIPTGDLGRVDAAGRLVVVDRRVDRIVRGGENVHPAEVEAVLEAHPAIAEAAVVGRPDRAWGHVPVAAIVLRAGERDPGDAALAAHARERLARFKVPVSWLRLDALPRTPAGKIQRDHVRSLVDGSAMGILARPGGDRIGWRVTGDGGLPVLLLPGTLSTAARVEPLAAALAAPGDVTVHAIDRRGSGTSTLAHVRPLDIAVHIDDLVAYVRARGLESAIVVGISFGGVIGLELAARHPGAVRAVVAWEPPYGPLASPREAARLRHLARRVRSADDRTGPAGAAETFMRAVAGDSTWDGLSDRGRAFLASEGTSAIADAALLGLDPDGLSKVAAPVAVLTGAASEPFYQPVADAVAARVPNARRILVPAFRHASPLTDPQRFATLVREGLAEAGVLPRAARDSTAAPASRARSKRVAVPTRRGTRS